MGTTMGHEMYQKDTYNINFDMIGGRQHRYNSPGNGEPDKWGKPSPQGGTRPNNNHDHNNDEEDNDDEDNNNDPPKQSHPPLQGVLQSAQGYLGAYSTPHPYQYTPPPYPNQLAEGGYHGGYQHVPADYPAGSSFVPHQGGYGSHGRQHMNDVGLVGAALGLASFGVFKLMRERHRHGKRY